MIKNLNETLSLITLIIFVLASLKIGLGFLFSSHLSGTVKGNIELLKDYVNNIEE